ncbi:MAG: hypothetical protein Kow00114_24280 [Kiloniellaceae bacterium]
MRLFILAFSLIACAATAAFASADWLRPDAAYSATRTVKAGGYEISGPLHYDSGKERFEMTMDGAQQIMIRREDKDRLYMIMPQMGMGMEIPLGGPQEMPSPNDYAELQPEAMGRETLNGEDVTKYRVEVNDGGQRYPVFVWATDDGIPLRVEGESAEGRFEMELSGLERGAQPAGLFEVPAGIQLMAMPGQ